MQEDIMKFDINKIVNDIMRNSGCNELCDNTRGNIYDSLTKGIEEMVDVCNLEIKAKEERLVTTYAIIKEERKDLDNKIAILTELRLSIKNLVERLDMDKVKKLIEDGD
jgi:hypothetical protein